MYVKESEVVVGARFDYFGHTVECTSTPRRIPGGVAADFVVVSTGSRYARAGYGFTDTIENLEHLKERN
jgi:hypothetical protein